MAHLCVDSRGRRLRFLLACSLGALACHGIAHAQTTSTAEVNEGLAHCAAQRDVGLRLQCYDALARAAVPSAAPDVVAPAPAASGASAPEPTPADTTGAVVRGPAHPEAEGARPAGNGFLSEFWELAQEDKRGTFNFVGYRPNFLLPVHFTSHLNSQPFTPTRGVSTLPDYQRVEAKLQLSLRTKVAQNVLLPGADVWFGYTQQSLWQVWNTQQSAPFRNTDYEPEVMYVVPIPQALGTLPFDWHWRFAQIAAAHQSNGQTKPLSRSWNRVYGGIGLEHGDVSVIGRVLRRLPENDDDNPDITDYRGRGDLLVSWTPGRATASLLLRSTLSHVGRGAVQLDVSYPVQSDRPNGLRWYVQVFSGYGETLLDYNFRQTSAGVGLTLFNF